MRSIAALGLFAAILFAERGSAEETRPLAEQYLHSGELAKGELALEDALAANLRDNQIRFGLGVLRFVRAFERLGQSLYEYGIKPKSSYAPLLRLPVPENPDPATIQYYALRRVVEEFHRDLSAAEAELAGITDEQVKLPIRIAAIHLDLDGDGQPTDRMADLLRKIWGNDLALANDEFLVHFDRADAAWLQGYCNLLMALVDIYLAFDLQQTFDSSADLYFSKPKNPYRGPESERWKRPANEPSLRIDQPARLRRFRQHLIKVAQLNRDTWKYARAETDDDREWLPNPQQHGVLGMPVRDEMIDAWIAAVDEVEAVLEGRKLFLKIFFSRDGKGINLKTVLDDPPDSFDHVIFAPQSLPEKYWQQGPDADLRKLLLSLALFDGRMFGYSSAFGDL